MSFMKGKLCKFRFTRFEMATENEYTIQNKFYYKYFLVSD